MAKTAELLLYGDVGWEITAADVAAEMKRIGAVDELHVRINSYGGDVFEGLAIYQRLAEQKARVIVHVDGIAASIASIMALAGAEILIARHGFIVIHDAWTIAAGNAREHREVADRLEAASAQLAGIYVRRTGRDMGSVRAWMDEEKEFDAEEAVKAGFATRIVEAERMAARFDAERHRGRKTPSERVLAPPRLAAAASAVARMQMMLRARSGRG